MSPLSDPTLQISRKETKLGSKYGLIVSIDRPDILIYFQWINRTCGCCEFCSAGDQPLCPESQLSGYTVDGTFQQYCICKAENAVRIPSGISMEEAAPVSETHVHFPDEELIH